MKHKKFISLGLLLGALTITSAVGLSLTAELNQIRATDTTYEIVLNKDNGHISSWKTNAEEVEVICKTETLNDVKFGYINCSEGTSKNHLGQLAKIDGQYYNKQPITNISKITVTTDTCKDNFLYFTLADSLENLQSSTNKIKVDVTNGNTCVLDKLSGNDYFFKISTGLQFAIIDEVRIEYTCKTKLGGDLSDADTKKIMFTANNLKITNSNQYSGTLSATINNETYNFYHNGLNPSDGNICEFSSYGSLYSAEEIVGLKKVDVEIEGLGQIDLCDGNFKAIRSLTLLDGINSFDINANETILWFKTLNESNAFVLKSFTLTIEK